MHGNKILAEDGDGALHAPESELADDVLAIITVFGARLYGSRSTRKPTVKAIEKECDDIGTVNMRAGGDNSDDVGGSDSDTSGGSKTEGADDASRTD